MVRKKLKAELRIAFISVGNSALKSLPTSRVGVVDNADTNWRVATASPTAP